MRKILYLLILVGLAAMPTDIQAQLSLSTPNLGTSGASGVAFEVTATRSVRIHRLTTTSPSVGSVTATVWGRPGSIPIPTTISTANGWTEHVPPTVVTGMAVNTPKQIPVDINLVLLAGQTYTFYVGNTVGGYSYIYNPTVTVFSDNNISININGRAGGLPTPTIANRGYDGTVEYFTLGATNDAAVVSVDSVVAACPGNQNVWATIGNYGSNQIDSVMVNWSWNGTAQTPINLITLLDTFNGTGSPTAPVFLGTRNLAAGQIYNLSVWTSNPNGVVDTVNVNDTIHTQVAASLSGIYTINSGAASGGVNFQSFTEAVDALNAFGVCGPTTFLVTPNSGPYKEQITIGEIQGASGINTITFDGGPTREEIWVDGTMTSSSDRQVIKLNGADHVTLRNLTINNHAAVSGGSWGVGIHLTNEADSNLIENCMIEVDSSLSSGSGNFVGIQMAGTFSTSNGASGSYNVIRNNTIHGGFYGITATGSASNNYEIGNRFEDNRIIDALDGIIYCRYQGGVKVLNNYGENRSPLTFGNTFGYGLYFFYADTAQIEGNTIINPTGYGIYMSNANRAAGSTAPSGKATIINNCISGEFNAFTTGGIYLASYAQNMDIFHNSISANAGRSTSSAACYVGTSTTNNNYNVQNNSFAYFGSNIGYAYYSSSSGPASLNYNNYYNNGDTARVVFLSGALGQGAIPGFAGYNNNSHFGDPLYVDNLTDLHSKGSQLWDRGNDTLGVTVDIDGDVRPGFGTLIPDIGCDEFKPPALDVTPTTLVSPTLPVCPGTFNVIVEVANLGQDTINSFTLNWSVNGVTQTAGNISGLSLPTNNSTTVSLGTLNIMGNVVYDIDFWTSSPNGGVDEDIQNDSLLFSGLRTGVASGTYVINSALPTGGLIYNSFQDVVNDLNAFGVCGPVTFVTAPGSGPYEEQIVLGEVQGASAVNTITFDGGPSQEEIFADSVTNSNQRAVITIDGGDYFTIKNLKVSNHAPATGTWYAFGIHLLGGADYNTIDNCIIEVDTAEVSTSTFRAGLALSGGRTSATFTGNSGNYNTFSNNTIHGGYYGMTLFGAGTTDFRVGNQVLNNHIDASYLYGIMHYYQDSTLIDGNTISMRTGQNVTTTIGYGIYTFYADHFTFSKNNILNPRYMGMYFSSGNRTATGEAHVVNNMITGEYRNSTRYGIYMTSYCRKINFFHNSVAINYSGNAFPLRTISTIGTDSLNIQNNSLSIFGSGGYPLQLRDSADAIVVNYNNYYSDNGDAVNYNLVGYDVTNYRGIGGFNFTSPFGDPGYVNNFSDLHVKGSQLWNVGFNGVGILEDIDGQMRPDSFIVDIGADEFRPPAQEAAFDRFLEPLTSCGYSSSSDVTVQIRNAGLEPIDSIQLTYVLNGGTPVTEWRYFTPGLPVGSSASHTFSTTVNLANLGSYDFDAWLSLPGDTCYVNDSLLNFTIWHDRSVSTYPHFEDFEVDNGGWRAEGAAAWEWGLPVGTTIDTAASGVKAWVTDTTGAYDVNECSWIISPCFDLTAVNLPQISFFINYDTRFSYDGVQFQASLDSGQSWFQIGDFANSSGTQINWYNDNSHFAMSNCLNLNIFGQQDGWSGQSNGWLNAYIRTDTLKNQPNVRFRFHFSTFTATNFNNWEGFGLDAFSISDVPGTDLGVVKIIEPFSGQCGDSMQAVYAVVQNFGSLEQNNYPVLATVTDTPGVVVGNLSTVVPDTLFPGDLDTVLVGFINTYAGGSFTVTAYTAIGGDSDPSNDTLILSGIEINPIPGPPMVAPALSCEADSFTLRVMSPDSNSFYAWYDTIGNAPIAISDTFTTPFLTQSKDYWVGTYAAPGSSLTTIFTGGNGQSGNMFDVTNVSNFPWNIDSLSQHIGSTGAETIEVYYVTNRTTYVGKETDATQWTQLGTASVTARGVGNPTPVPIGGLTIFPGETIGLYVTVLSTAIDYTTLTAITTYTDGNLSIVSGVGKSYPFGATFQPRGWNGTLHYSGGGCPSELAKVTATISPIASPNLGPDGARCGGLLLDAGAGYATYTWNNNVTTQQNLANVTGTYSVMVADANGCTASDTINLIINPNPIVDLGVDTTVCGSLLLDAGNPGATWTWSDGSVSQTYLVTQSGPEFVNVVDANGCETRDTINVNVNALPPVDLGMDRVECDSVLLDANNPGLPVMWNDGSTNQTLSASTTGLYYVSVTDPATNCIGTDSVNLTINPSPVVALGDDGDYCDILQLDAGAGAIYDWSTFDLTQTIFVTQANEGTIWVNVSDINGCTGTDTITVNIVDQPAPSFTSMQDVSDPRTFDFTDGSSGENLVYSWDFGDGNTSVIQNPSHTYGAGGTYDVCLTVSNACDTLTTCRSVEAFGSSIQDDLLANSINLYPNPTTDVVNIDFSGLNEDIEVTIADVTGRIIAKEIVTRFAQANTQRYDLSDEAKGVYTISFKMGDRRLTRRVVLK